MLDSAMARNSDRKSTRLNSSHRCISYAVFCLKKKNRVVGMIGPPLEEQRHGVAQRLRPGLDAGLPLGPLRLVAIGRGFETEVGAFLGRCSAGRHRSHPFPLGRKFSSKIWSAGTPRAASR